MIPQTFASPWGCSPSFTFPVPVALVRALPGSWQSCSGAAFHNPTFSGEFNALKRLQEPALHLQPHAPHSQPPEIGEQPKGWGKNLCSQLSLPPSHPQKGEKPQEQAAK